MHVAFHYLGCAQECPEGLRAPSRVGVLIECLTDVVDQVTVVAYDPPARPMFEDGTEYLIECANVSLLSLGAKGSRRDHLERRKRVGGIVAPASTEWDVLIFLVPNRRALLVHRASACVRNVAFVVGTTATGSQGGRWAFRRRLVGALNRMWTEYQQRRILRGSALTLINSDELRASVREHARNIKVVTLSARRERHVFESADRFNGPNLNLMVAGRVTVEKGVIDAVEAFALVKRSFPGARLHVIGEGPALDAMLSRASDLRVREGLVLYGWIPSGDELFALFRGMDVFVLASFAAYEGFPQVIWEAMAHSVPVICTPVRGTQGVLEHERDVLFVPMRDPNAMADAVVRLANEPDLLCRIISNGFDLARRTSMDRTVADIVAGIGESWPELARR